MNPNFQVRKAKRQACKASIQIEGLTGLGKSGLALIMGYILAGNDWTKVGCVDTENKSLDLFEGLPSSMGEKFGEFNKIDLTSDIGYKPSHYLACRESLLKAGCTVVIKDSISHAWQYKGGVLDMVTKVQTTTKNQYAAWGDSEVVNEKNELLQLIRDHRCHVITTVRVKEKHEIIDGKPVSLGEQQIQQAELKYEPDLVLHMISPGSKTASPQARIIKTRYAIFEKDQIYSFSPDTISQLRAYLAEGVDPEVILEQQRQDYILGVKAHLDAKPSAAAIWNVMKTDAGFKDTKLTDLPLDIIKGLFIRLTD